MLAAIRHCLSVPPSWPALVSSAAITLALVAPIHAPARAAAAVGSPAPDFTLQNQDGKPVTLSSRKGKGWSVLYFYPKAGTPGCTDQACAFRDSVSLIRAKNAEVFGISADTVGEQKAFHAKHKLTFDLLADPEDKAISSYGVKMPVAPLAKRWTFIVDPDLVVRHVTQDVDPVLDAKNSAAKLAELQNAAAKAPAAAKKS